MAKGNLFQGMGRGKVGDVVFSRLNGQQISRVRNRKPNNPKTNAQLLQRAVMATVMQAYSAGKIIFDHSFQGAKVPSGSMQKFMSINAKKIRAMLANDIANGSTDARLVGPGTKDCAPNLFQISDGSLTQNIIVTGSATVAAGGTDKTAGTGLLPAIVANETIAEYVSRIGLVSGDILTLCLIQAFDAGTGNAVFIVGDSGNPLAEQTSSFFGFLRLIVKPEAFASDTVITESTKWTDIFHIDTYQNIDVDPDTPIHNPWITGDNTPAEGSNYAFGWIRSRMNTGERSKCTLEYPTWINEWEPTSGLAGEYVLEGWKQGTQDLGDSDLILEGSGF